MSGDLVAFLRARLHEDEQSAKAAATRESGGASWSLIGDHESEVQAGSGLRVARRTPPVLARHIARHDPARVLRNVAVNRELVAMYEKALRDAESAEDLIRVPARMALLALRPVLPQLASVYADHPDYREEWRT